MAGIQSTTQQRRNWAPACKSKGNIFIDAFRAKDAVFKAWNYPHNRSYTGCYACRAITGGTDYSLHAFGPGDAFTHWCGTKVNSTALAEDVNASQNPYGPRLVTDRKREMVDAMQAIRTNSGAQVWRWGGYYTNNKDAMHDEIVCTPADLKSGINWATVKGGSPDQSPEEDDMARLVKGDQSHEWWVMDAMNKRYVGTQGHAAFGSETSLGLWQGAHPTVIPQAFVNEMPTLITEAWIRSIGDWIIKEGHGQRMEIMEAIRAANTSGGLSDEQVARVVTAIGKELKVVAKLSDEERTALAELTADKVIEEIAS